MSSSPKKVAGQVRRVINRLIFLEKRSVFKHGILRLYPSEIHLMQVLKETPDLNAGKMAQRLGISNGAVSQTLARLERKKLIIKTKDPALKNELTVTFTKSGKAAIQGFEKEQAPAIDAFSGYLSGLSDNDINVIESFLSHMEDLLKRLE